MRGGEYWRNMSGGRVLEEHEWGGEYWRNMSGGKSIGGT